MFYPFNLNGRYSSVDLAICWRTILKKIARKQGVTKGILLILLNIESDVVCLDHSSEHSGFKQS
jgi:hypothetical protein